jgi:DNA-directed RNA polymerase subunit alpha
LEVLFMHIRWRGLELPSRVTRDEAVSTAAYGRFIVEPFEHGFGTTIGNSLRRVLLSSLEGAAVTSVKIAGVSHEFTPIDGVLEDVTDIILNIKGVMVSIESEESKSMRVTRDKAGVVKAGDIQADPAITIVNPEHHIATLTADVPFAIEMEVRSGRGFSTGEENRAPDHELGVIPVDAVFSPVVRVRYHTEDMRVGQRTNYDRLVLEVWTKGTVKPEDALIEAGTILRKHLNPFVMYHDLGEAMAAPPPAAPQYLGPEDERLALLDQPISALSLSVRSANCLEQARIATIGELVAHSEVELLRVRSFGRTALHEVQRRLAELGLALNMKAGIPDEESPGETGDATPAEGDEPSEGAGDGNEGPGNTGQLEAYTMD